jgi:hypothetical protein
MQAQAHRLAATATSILHQTEPIPQAETASAGPGLYHTSNRETSSLKQYSTMGG